jgi:glycosyltransferase involved in cell wall biosynthesis
LTRIAYICADPGVPIFGRKGASVHVQEVIRALSRRGVEVVLFAARLGGEPAGDLEGLHVIALPEVAAKDAAEREQRLRALNPIIGRLLGENGHFDAVYERHSLWIFAGMEWALRAGIPGLLEVNAPLLIEQAGYRTLHDEAGARAAVERAYRAAGAILAVSQGVARYVSAFAPGLGEKVHVVPNGVDVRRFDCRQEWAPIESPPHHRLLSRRERGEEHPHPHSLPLEDKDEAEFTVGFVGTLKPWHGVETLIDAFARVHSQKPAVRLVIVGDGPQREALQAHASELGLGDSVEFTGAVDPAEIPAQLARIDVAVAPYPDLEDFYFSPLKLYEYMAAGCAVVASAVGQITDVIADETTGLLYPPGDVSALAAAIDRLRREPSLRMRLAEAARRQVLERHTWDQVAERILTLVDGARCTASSREVTVQ